MEKNIETMTAAEALREWQYAKRQISPRGNGGKAFQKSVANLFRLTSARLNLLWEQHEISIDEFGDVSLYLAKYNPKELQALLEWHNEK